MIESLIKLPDDMFKLQMLDFLTIHDIVALDNACTERKYRQRLLLKMQGTVLKGEPIKPMSCGLFEWLGCRGIYVMLMRFQDNFPSLCMCIESNYQNQFQHLKLLNLNYHIGLSRKFNGPLTDELLHVLTSYCPTLQQIKLNDRRNLTDNGLRSIAENCRNLTTFSANGCRNFTDDGVIYLSKLCTGLKKIHLGWLSITDNSIISLSEHCKDLVEWNVFGCVNLTDASVASIVKHHSTCCEVLNLNYCSCLTDASVLTIASHCSVLTYLTLLHCNKVTERYQRNYLSLADLHAIIDSPVLTS